MVTVSRLSQHASFTVQKNALFPGTLRFVQPILSLMFHVEHLTRPLASEAPNLRLMCPPHHFSRHFCRSSSPFT